MSNTSPRGFEREYLDCSNRGLGVSPFAGIKWGGHQQNAHLRRSVKTRREVKSGGRKGLGSGSCLKGWLWLVMTVLLLRLAGGVFLSDSCEN